MNISLESTRTTPKAEFHEGYIQIEGKSIPVSDTGFYNSVVDFTWKYSAKPAPVTVVDLDFDCINAYSKKRMMQFFIILELIHSRGNRVEINWIYDTEDDSMFELGSIYQTLIKIPFNFIVK
jgi:hypothetical protein